MTTQPQKYTFHVSGMHCKACVLMIESELKDLPHIMHAQSSLSDHSVEVTGDFGGKSAEQVALELTDILKPHGYTLLIEKQQYTAKWGEFKIAVPIAFGFVLLFITLQKMGIVNLVDASEVTYGTAFVIGIIASLSTCMAVVGGLVLSMSATFAKEGDKIKPQLMFHGGRLISFFILGGVIGALGSAFTLSTSATVVLNLLVGLVMLVLGINLLDTFHFAKRFQLSMPKFIAKYAHGISKFNHTLTPVFVGIATFFLPCGFTQSMQLYALSTGSFWIGGLTMLSFALGTLPVLALVSFGSAWIKKLSTAGIFFKSAGLIVILFALLNLINSLVLLGLIPPLFNF